jgi:hypothetical protein
MHKKRILTVIYHYLLKGDTNGGRPHVGGIILRKCLKFETRKCYFLHYEHQKNKKKINNNVSLLSGRKT